MAKKKKKNKKKKTEGDFISNLYYDYLNKQSGIDNKKYSFEVIFKDKRGKYHISRILSTSFEEVIKDALELSSPERKLFKISWEYKNDNL